MSNLRLLTISEVLLVLIVATFLLFPVSAGPFDGPLDVGNVSEQETSVNEESPSCYIETIDNYIFCTSSPNPASFEYTHMTNCKCIERELQDETLITACDYTATHYERTGTGVVPVFVSRHLLGNPSLCTNLCEQNRTLTSHSGYRCYTNEDWGPDMNLCGTGLLYTPQFGGTAQECFANENNGDPDPFDFQEWCSYADTSYFPPQNPAPNPVTETLERPCCLDQDGDNRGVEEYQEGMCGHDCSDSNKDVWRGCSRMVRNVELNLMNSTLTKLHENNVNLFYRENRGSNFVGKQEKCDQNTNWNADGVLPRNSWQCQGIAGWEEPDHANNGENEYPVAGTMYVEGNKVQCSFLTDNEQTRWGPILLSTQKFHVELQQKSVPGNDWMMSYVHDQISLDDNDCSDGNCCQLTHPENIPSGVSVDTYLKDHTEEFRCQGWFGISEQLRGNQARCFVYPYNDQKNDYWKAKNVTTPDVIIPEEVSVALPVDLNLQNIYLRLDFSGGRIPPTYARLPITKTILHNSLSSNVHDALDIYLDVKSDANARLADYSHKSIFVEEQIPNTRVVSGIDFALPLNNIPSPSDVLRNNQRQRTLRVVDYFPIIHLGFAGSAANMNRFEFPGIYVNDRNDYRALFSRFDYDYRSTKDVIVLEYEPITYTFPAGSVVSTQVSGVTYTIDLSDVTITEDPSGESGLSMQNPIYSVLYLPSNAPPNFVVSHEYGHIKGNLCDENDYGLWQAEYADQNGCPNLFPLCCLGVGGQALVVNGQTIASGNVVNACGTPAQCPGMPYYSDAQGRDVPDPLGTRPNEWQWRSIMSAFANTYSTIYPTTGSPQNYQATDICELRAWPGVPDSETICQQK